MKSKKILSVILIVLGICLYLVGNYISNEVAKGRGQIASAQQSVDAGSKFAPSGPVGDLATGSIQRKIDEGKQEADKYQVLANWLHVSGVVVFIAGLGILIFSFVRKKTS